MTNDDVKKITAVISYECWTELQDIKNRKRTSLPVVVAEILEKYTSKRQSKKDETT